MLLALPLCLPAAQVTPTAKTASAVTPQAKAVQATPAPEADDAVMIPTPGKDADKAAVAIPASKAPVVVSAAADDEIVEEIKITGNTTVEPREIMDTVSYGVGMVFSKYKTREDIRSLYKTGKFEDVSVDFAKVDGKNVLTYQVAEKPRIGKVIIKGNKDVSEGDIKGKLDNDEKTTKIKELEYFDEYLLKRAIAEVMKMYKERNFYDAKISYALNPYEDEHKRGKLMEITIEVSEGGKLKVKSITAAGNKAFGIDKIKGAMDMKEEGWFQSGVFDDTKFIEDLKKILKVYYQEGYVKAKIGKYTAGEIELNRDQIISDYVKIDRENNSINIVIPVEEGIKYTIKSVAVSGSALFTSGEILDKMESKPEKIFDSIMFENDINVVKSMYAGKGYIFAQLKDSYVYDDDIGTVGIKLDITEGSVAYISQIKIRGNYVTKDKVIRRELNLEEGAAFDSNKIRKAQESVYNLGFFDNVLIDTEQVDFDKLNLIFEVVEKKTGNIGLGAGYSTVEGLVGYVQLSQSNLFGEGKSFSADVQFGNQKKSWQLSYKDPWFFDTPTSFGADVWNIYKDQAYNNQGYDLDTYGFNLSFGQRFGLEQKVFMTYRYEQDKYTHPSTQALADAIGMPFNIDPALNTAEKQTQISSITPMYVYDTRDDIFDANRGVYASVSLQFGGGWLGGDYNYIKTTADIRYFVPSFWKFVLALHAMVGNAASYKYGNGEDTVPLSERFYCGGTDTVRGYEERALGPVEGGDFTIVTNIEYKCKLVERVLTLAAFYDGGNCWRKFSDVDWLNPNLPGSVGFGARLTIPGTVMVLRLDWGYALDHSMPGGKIHFNIGNIF